MAVPDQGEEEPPRSSSVGFLLDYYGGQILFRPTNADSFLYLVTGPAQSDDGQLQAKILRFRVGGMPLGMHDLLVCFFIFHSSSYHKNKSSSNLNIICVRNRFHGGPSIRIGLRRPEAMCVRCRQASRPLLCNR
jgi:hypothetical protein